MSVAILIFLLSFQMLKPHGLAASCGIEKGLISKSPISNLSETLNVLTFFSALSRKKDEQVNSCPPLWLIRNIQLLFW